MSTPTTITESSIMRIRTLATELDQLGRTALEKAIEAGNLLRQCKADLPHGGWLPWIQENFSFSARTASRWMKVAEAGELGLLKSDSVSDLSDAYQLLTTPRPPKPEFKLPLPGQRLVLVLEPDHFAALEPMDNDFTHVSLYHDDMVSGYRKAVRNDAVYMLLAELEPQTDWTKAAPAYTPYEPEPGIRNRNVMDDPTGEG